MRDPEDATHRDPTLTADDSQSLGRLSRTEWSGFESGATESGDGPPIAAAAGVLAGVALGALTIFLAFLLLRALSVF